MKIKIPSVFLIILVLFSSKLSQGQAPAGGGQFHIRSSECVQPSLRLQIEQELVKNRAELKRAGNLKHEKKNAERWFRMVVNTSHRI